MIIGTITLITLYLGGGAGAHTSVLDMLAEMSTLIEDYVADPVRAEAAQRTVTETKAQIEEAILELNTYRRELISSGQSTGPDRAQLAAIFAKIDEVRQGAEREFIRGQLKLRESIVEEEWDEIFGELKLSRN